MGARKITKEEKMADIAEAKKCFEEAHALMEKGKRLIKKNMRGVEVTAVSTDGGRYYLPKGEADIIEVHLYSGILKLEKLFEEKCSCPVEGYDSVALAFDRICRERGEAERIYVAGSLYLVGEIKELLL